MTIFKKLIELENAADEFGFRWDNTDQIMAQIHSECGEVGAHLADVGARDSRIKLQEEIGDLLHAVFSLCIFCEFDPLETVEKSLSKFERRFTEVKRLAHEQGLSTLNGKSFQELMMYWSLAKESVG